MRRPSEVVENAVLVLVRWNRGALSPDETMSALLELHLADIEFQANAVAFKLDGVQYRIKHSELRL